MSDTRRVYINAAAAIGPAGDSHPAERKVLVSDPLQADLYDRVKALTGLEMRRAGHFTELAIFGSQLAIARLGSRIGRSAPLYFGTGLGEVHETVALFEQVMEGGAGATSPYGFVNSVSNTTAFHVAKTAGLTSANITVSQEELSFEWALQLAAGDIIDGSAAQALVGGVDELSHPRADHVKRMPLKDGEIMGEGSGWLCLGSEGGKALGEVIGVIGLATDHEDIEVWSRAIAEAAAPWLTAALPVFLMPGLRLSGAHIEAVLRRMKGAQVMDYLHLCGRFHVAAAFGIAAIFDARCAAETLFIHVSANTEGRTMIVGVKAFGQTVA